MSGNGDDGRLIVQGNKFSKNSIQAGHLFPH